MDSEIANRIRTRLEPLVKEVMTTTDRYDSCPSIQNGSRRQDARQ